MPEGAAPSRASTLVILTTTGTRDLAPLLRAMRQQAGPSELRVVVNATFVPGALRASLLDTDDLVHEPHVGYASARNAGLRSLSDYEAVVFFDDDQLPSDGWLTSLLTAAAQSGATVVLGPVDSVVPGRGWADASHIRPKRPEASGPHLGEGYSGNTLIRTDFLARTGLQFDTRFDRTGGEDTDFFRRARAHGATIYYAAAARAVETVDPCRVTALGRLVAGRSAGKRYRQLQGFSRLNAAKKCLRLGSGLLWLIYGGASLSRRAAGRGLFDVGNAAGYLIPTRSR